ncbi:MAG: hypothetical protein J4478_04115 [Candidatus Diapherotrites archaeon]|uniref:Uncharacterized protein n=1 Tax=Candidatus Iainarchaeum sp. TaxID=3101447 RepID=A0A8T4KZF5_9ARCH|nr:hypothetical protein [Candidatus Diapherotrites archaeon]
MEPCAGLSKKNIDAILEEREAFLKKLLNNNIRAMPDVSAAVQQYIAQKRTID